MTMEGSSRLLCNNESTGWEGFSMTRMQVLSGSSFTYRTAHRNRGWRRTAGGRALMMSKHEDEETGCFLRWEKRETATTDSVNFEGVMVEVLELELRNLLLIMLIVNLWVYPVRAALLERWWSDWYLSNFSLSHHKEQLWRQHPNAHPPSTAAFGCCNTHKKKAITGAAQHLQSKTRFTGLESSRIERKACGISYPVVMISCCATTFECPANHFFLPHHSVSLSFFPGISDSMDGWMDACMYVGEREKGKPGWWDRCEPEKENAFKLRVICQNMLVIGHTQRCQGLIPCLVTKPGYNYCYL